MTKSFMHHAGHLCPIVLLAPAIAAVFATVIVWDWLDKRRSDGA